MLKLDQKILIWVKSNFENNISNENKKMFVVCLPFFIAENRVSESTTAVTAR